MASDLTETEEFLVDLLKILARGCTYHNFYRGHQIPKVECEHCKKVFIAYQRWLKFKELNEIEV